jgi:hypothetical protein
LAAFPLDGFLFPTSKSINSENTHISRPKCIDLAQVAGLSLGALLIIVILGASIVLLLPSSPRISVTFEVLPVDTYSAKLKLDYANYEKVSLGIALGSARGTPVLTLTAVQGTFALNIVVTYSGEVIASNPTPYTGIGNGLYQTTVTFLPRQEPAGVPYSFTISLLRDSTTVDHISFDILPS